MTAPSTKAGAFIYNGFTLSFYDVWVLRLSNSFAWHCPTVEVLLPFFRENMTVNHLDVGVGTGFYPAAAESKRVCLVDLNARALQTAQQRIRSAHPLATVHTVVADATRPLPAPLAGQKFDSISAFYLLHCMPGSPPETKLRLFSALRPHLAEDGVLVGATILGKVPNKSQQQQQQKQQQEIQKGLLRHHSVGEEKLNWFAWGLMTLYNALGVFSNWKDEPGMFEDSLLAEFAEVETWIVGRVLLFRARKPRQR